MSSRLYEVDLDLFSLSKMFEWCLLQGGNRILSVVRTHKSARALTSARELFAPNLCAEFNAWGWPGTKSLGGDNMVLEAEFDSKLAAKLIEREPSLDQWRDYNLLPEDLCIFATGSDWPMFFSATPEPAAWMIWNSPIELTGVTPSLNVLTRKFIHSDKSFCRTRPL